MKFKIGDKLVPLEPGRGFENATVTGFIEKKGRQYYTLKILCGTATIPISAEDMYKISEE